MISISMTTADGLGQVVLLNHQSELGRSDARVARRATLDGGCAIIHSGISEGDRTFDIKATINSGQKASIEYIYENSILALISCKSGLYLGAISMIDTSTPFLTMTFLIKSKEA